MESFGIEKLNKKIESDNVFEAQKISDALEFLKSELAMEKDEKRKVDLQRKINEELEKCEILLGEADKRTIEMQERKDRIGHA